MKKAGTNFEAFHVVRVKLKRCFYLNSDAHATSEPNSLYS